MIRIRIEEDTSIQRAILSVESPLSSTTENLNVSFNSNSSIIREHYEQLVLSGTVEEIASKTSDHSAENSDSITTNEYVIPVRRDIYSILSSMYENETYETGIVNPSEKYFIEEFQRDAIGALNTLNLLFWDNFAVSGRKTNNLIGILHTISHLGYKEVYPIGVSMAVSALNHNNQEVCEYAIKCFENWNHLDGVKKLKAVKFASKWLEEYACAVIEEIEEQ